MTLIDYVKTLTITEKKGVEIIENNNSGTLKVMTVKFRMSSSAGKGLVIKIKHKIQSNLTYIF